MSRCLFGVVLALALVAPARAQIQFTDVSAATGASIPHVDVQFMMGAGGAFLDYDGDAWMDLLVTGGIGAPYLLRNQGGSFTDVTATSGLVANPFLQFTMGAACADHDNDGDTDVFLVNYGFDQLYRNDAGHFSAVGPTAGVVEVVPRWGSSAVFGDYDQDGFLDLYVGNYIKTLSYPHHTPWPNTLYHNQGDGTFLDVTDLCGVGGAGTTLAVQWSDFDEDGDADLWVANDFGAFIQPNQLYRNDGPGGGLAWQFADVAPTLHANAGIYCMGTTAGDIDHDLDLDYYFSNLGRNVLLRNDGATGFTDITTASGTEGTYDPTALPKFATSWGVGFHDFDADGWVDLYVSNGHIPAAPEIDNGTQTPSFVYRNNADNSGTFTDVTFSCGAADPQIGRGCAFADYDNDGDVDVAQFNINGLLRLFRNDAAPHRWLRALPIGRLSNRDGAGTRCIAHLADYSLVREANAHYSFESSSDRAIQLAAPGHTSVGHLELRWPSGVRQDLYRVATDQSIEVLEPILTCDRTAPIEPRVGPGQTLAIPLTITNHTAAPKQALYFLELRAGTWSWQGFANQVTVPALGAVDASLPFLIPLRGNHGTPVKVEFLWHVFDKGGALDQWSAEVLVTG